MPDPYLIGGGLHETKKDGFLKIHSDFYLHQYLKIDRKEANQVNIDIVRTYSSEKYLRSDARNECGVKFIQFWSQS